MVDFLLKGILIRRLRWAVGTAVETSGSLRKRWSSAPCWLSVGGSVIGRRGAPAAICQPPVSTPGAFSNPLLFVLAGPLYRALWWSTSSVTQGVIHSTGLSRLNAYPASYWWTIVCLQERESSGDASGTRRGYQRKPLYVF